MTLVSSTLQSLILFGNKLNGSIPWNQMSLPSLQKLFVQNNNLTGTLPSFNTTAITFPSLQQIQIQDNRFVFCG